ncbi:MAG: 50S ribosomal protein L11 methyltransferase [Lawsonibacter sp.]|nr:50S ribosomal protein L11 methyltransferase [Lawsonibacter sp.]
MDEIKWLEIAVNTTPDKLDEVCARLAAAGMDSLVIEDEGEFLTFLEQNRQCWDYVDQELLDRMRGAARVKFYVTDDDDGHAQLEQYTRGLNCEYTAAPLADNDWAYSWQKYYKPLEIGRRLYVVPQWMREEPVPHGRVPFYLNPGLTFGTGSHASTQLCLEGVEEHTVPGRDVLDLGCGDTALAVELARKRYHLVLANIVADVIIPLAPQAPGLLEEDGIFLCSGIIDVRAGEVEAALKRAGLTVTGKREKNGWAALEARR